MYFGFRILGNFRPSKAERVKAREHQARAKYDARPGNDKDHLALITQLPCCLCGRKPPGTEYHHLKSGPAKAERGAGQKATDKWAIPLCHEHHMNGVERRGSRSELDWFKDQGLVDPCALAEGLWRLTGDLVRMTRLTMQFWGGP